MSPAELWERAKQAAALLDGFAGFPSVYMGSNFSEAEIEELARLAGVRVRVQVSILSAASAPLLIYSMQAWVGREFLGVEIRAQGSRPATPRDSVLLMAQAETLEQGRQVNAQLTALGWAP